MRVLGIDPGTALMGYGVVEGTGSRQRALAYGCLETAAGQPAHLRLAELYRGLMALVAEHRPDAMAVEELFFGRNVTTAILVGQARGVVLLAAAHGGLAVREYTPAQVKQALVGYGKADKVQMQKMTQRLLGLTAPPYPDDAADALAVAMCCLASWHLENRTRGLNL